MQSDTSKEAPKKPAAISNPVFFIGGCAHGKILERDGIADLKWRRWPKILNGVVERDETCDYRLFYINACAVVDGVEVWETFWFYRYYDLSPEGLIQIVKPHIATAIDMMAEQELNGRLCHPLKAAFMLENDYQAMDAKLMRTELRRAKGGKSRLKPTSMAAQQARECAAMERAEMLLLLREAGVTVPY